MGKETGKLTSVPKISGKANGREIDVAGIPGARIAQQTPFRSAEGHRPSSSDRHIRDGAGRPIDTRRDIDADDGNPAVRRPIHGNDQLPSLPAQRSPPKSRSEEAVD